MKISLFTLFALLVSHHAFAASGIYPFTLVPKEECLTTLAEIFAPSEAIKAGLNAISGLNLDGGAISSCVDEMAADPAAFPRLVNVYYSSVPAQRIARDMQELDRKSRCALPNSSPEEQEYFKKNRAQQCENKFLTAEEGKALQAERQRLYRLNGLFNSAPYSAINPNYEAKAALRKEQLKLNYCKKNPYNANSSSAKYFDDKFNAYCADHQVLDEEQLKNQAELVSELEQKISEQQKKDAPYRQKLMNLFGNGDYVVDYFYERAEELTPFLKNMICIGPAEGSPEFNDWKWDRGQYCDGKSLSGDFEAARAALFDKLGDLDELKKQVDASNKEAFERQKALQKVFDEKRFRSYGFRRLLAQFQYYLDHGGSAQALEPFCDRYAKDMQRDKEFTEQEYPNKQKLNLSNFDDEGSWSKVKKHGLTEGEYTALRSYIGSFYGVVNPPLYKKEPPTPAITSFRDMLNSALSKIPAYDGGRPVKRFAQLSEDILKEHKVGSVVTYESFTSTSKRKDWHWSGNTRFLIFTAKGGKDLKDYNEGEAEVLFPAGTHFKVLAKDNDGSKTNLVMVETDSSGKALAAVTPLTNDEKHDKKSRDDDDDDHPKKKKAKKGGKKK